MHACKRGTPSRTPAVTYAETNNQHTHRQTPRKALAFPLLLPSASSTLHSTRLGDYGAVTKTREGRKPRISQRRRSSPASAVVVGAVASGPLALLVTRLATFASRGRRHIVRMHKRGASARRLLCPIFGRLCNKGASDTGRFLFVKSQAEHTALPSS